MTRATSPGLPAVAVVAAIASAAAAQPNATHAYRVKPKDTLDVIAAEFYGERDHAIYIVAENKLKDRRVRPYERLRIPVPREITTDNGDSFESLAQTHLGDARRAPVLADYNGLNVIDMPASGTALAIPFHVTHVAQGTESLAQIATLYLGDGKQADFVRRYNFLDKTALEKGETVIVPVVNVHVRASRLAAPDTEARARRDKRKTTAAEAAALLPAARAAWLQGDFSLLTATLAPLADRLEYLDTAVMVDVGILLGKARIAFDDTAAAVAVFSQVLDRKPTHRLDPYAESPKVLDAWIKAGGQLQE